ncbi:MAG: thiamine-phosphate kinase [Actinomycetes bacterium]
MSQDQTVGELGEFALIDAIAQRLATATADRVPVGIGDDSAVVSAHGGNVVACLDMLTQGVHFRLDWSEAKDIGRKAAAQNLADIFAMGATPTALLVGLALPSSTLVSWVMGLADGLSEEAGLVGVSVVGGDIVRGDSIVISVTALGELGERTAILRSGAKAGDVVALAGRLGFAQAGLLMLSRGFRSPRVLVGAHRVPEPPYELVQLATHASSMIDISDGLVSDLGHIAKASDVSINIDTKSFEVPEPLAAAASAFNGDAIEWILTGGEDHAFAATFSNALDVPTGWTIIGIVSSGAPGVLVDGEPYSGTGWDHFSSN